MNCAYKLLILIVMISPIGSEVAQGGPSEQRVTRPHLYAVESNGKVSFVFGTRHSNIPLSKLPEFVTTALRSRALVATESVNTLPDGSRKVESQISYPDLPMPSPRAQTALRNRGIPEHLFRSAWICTFYVMWETIAGPSMDSAFEGLARTLRKPIEELDDERDSDLLSRAFAPATNNCNIEDTTLYVSVEKLRADSKLALENYVSGDLNTIETCDDHCHARTQKWLTKFDNFHESLGVFAFVGIRHLASSTGMVELLRTRGYNVAQVKNMNQLRQILGRETRLRQ